MEETENYIIKDISLAEKGRKNISLSIKEMPVLTKIKERYEKEKPFDGIKIGMALHITTETAYLVDVLVAGGAEVAICGCNPLSSMDDCVAYLAKKGVKVYCYRGETIEDYYKFINKVIEFAPHITIDDGCDLVKAIHEDHPELINEIIGGCEETTTGIHRLKAMQKDNALKYPMIAVNDNFTKHLFDNYYGTGQSALDGVIRASNYLIAGKNVVIVGYGDCGKGLALRAKGMGGNVIVTEIDAKPALQAAMDGHRVMKMEDASVIGDIFISVTGNKHVIPLSIMKKMKDGVILANAGHFDNEIDVVALEENAQEKENIRTLFDRYNLDGKDIYLCGEGRLVNLANAEGHPSSVLDLSFAGQALGAEYLVKNKGNLPNEVINLPDDLDSKIAEMKVKCMNIELDELTDEQRKYLNSWEEGT
jgi:adenosylhomocysteinase